MDLTVRPITDSEVAVFRRQISRGFGGDVQEEDDSRFRAVFDLDRTVAAFDGTDLIGTCAAYTFTVTVPGGELPMGGTTIVTVQATHRRRGVLRAMMRAHLDEVQSRGEPLAGLWASEASIYGRFGFGPAAEGYEMSLAAKTIQFTGDAPAGRVTLLERGEAESVFPGVYERIRPTRPGMLSRSDDWWRTQVFDDPKHRREGRSSKRFAVYTSAGGADGYAIYRQKEKWEQEFPVGEVFVVEVLAATPEAHDGLWRYLTTIDLFPNVRYWNVPVDDELPWRVTEARRVQRRIGDSLWVRLLDIPAALTGRTYRSDGHLVLGIRDPFLPGNDGNYELTVDAGAAQCRRTDAEADLRLDVDALGALYLGAHRASTLAFARRVSGSEQAIATANQLFAWDPAPWCPEVF